MPIWPSPFVESLRGCFPTTGPLSVLAYLDPGMGSYAFQILLASAFGAMFAFRQSWYEVRAWLTDRFGRRS